MLADTNLMSIKYTVPGTRELVLNALIRSYGANLPTLDVTGPPVGGWPVTDYDTIWTVTLDAQGNLTIDNEMCEGIDSSGLSAVAPLF